MIKRFLFYLCLCLAVFGCVVTVYKKYKPTDISEQQIKINYSFDKVYTIDEFNEYVMNQTDSIIVIYFDEDSLNSQYFFNTTLPSVLSQKGLASLQNVVYVNIASIPETMTSAMAKIKYGYSSVPCLAKIKYEEASINVQDILEEDGESNFTTETIISWLEKNNVIPQ